MVRKQLVWDICQEIRYECRLLKEEMDLIRFDESKRPEWTVLAEQWRAIDGDFRYWVQQMPGIAKRPT